MDWRSANFFLFDGDVSGNRLDTVRSNFSGFLNSYKDSGLNTVTLTWYIPVDPSSGKFISVMGRIFQTTCSLCRTPEYFAH